jgi:hypothetical protein
MRFDWKLSLLVWGLGALGCADFHRGPAPRDSASIADPDAGESKGADAGTDAILEADLTFEAEVYPILLLRCEDCHKAGGEAGTSSFVLTGNARMDRAMVLALTVPGDAAASRLLRRATGEMHEGGTVLNKDTPDYDTIFSWLMLLPLPDQP